MEADGRRKEIDSPITERRDLPITLTVLRYRKRIYKGVLFREKRAQAAN